MSDKAKQEREHKLAQIRALMARTVDNGCTEAEVKAAAAAVDRLLAKYEIDLDEVTVKEQEIVRLAVSGRHHEVSGTALAIAAFTDCKVWADGPNLMYFGFKVDTEIAEYLTMIFRRAMDRDVDKFTMFNADYNGAPARAVRDAESSFKVGMGARLGERLNELKSKRDFTQRTSGRDLVLIKTPLVQDAFAALGLTLGRGGHGYSVRDTGAFKAGRIAGDSVSINQGIAGRAATSGRLR
jgi:hypothetical protein